MVLFTAMHSSQVSIIQGVHTHHGILFSHAKGDTMDGSRGQ